MYYFLAVHRALKKKKKLNNLIKTIKYKNLKENIPFFLFSVGSTDTAKFILGAFLHMI